jgi:2'-5' RNA ligase
MRGVRQGAVAQFLGEFGDLHMEPFTVTRFVLLSARPGSGGPPYGIEAEYPFQGADTIHQAAEQG